MRRNLTHLKCFNIQLWRVNKVLQFARVKIKTWKIAIPITGLFLSSLIILAVWTVIIDFGWYRTVINDFTGESYGTCGNPDDDSWGWFIATLLTSGIPIVLALVMAWKTKDVEDSFSESWWIFSLVFVQLQVSSVMIYVIFIIE